jgi:hypothetical protein
MIKRGSGFKALGSRHRAHSSRKGFENRLSFCMALPVICYSVFSIKIPDSEVIRSL